MQVTVGELAVDVELLDAREAAPAQPSAGAAGHDHADVPADQPQRWQMQVVTVEMGDEDDVGVAPLIGFGQRAHPSQPAHTAREHRIGEHHMAGQFEADRRMPQETQGRAVHRSEYGPPIGEMSWKAGAEWPETHRSVDAESTYAGVMCRNITTLRGLEPSATAEEIEAASRQYVRKVTGIQSLSDQTREPFETAVAEITAITTRLLSELPARRQPPPTVPPLRRPEVQARIAAKAARS